MADFDEGLAIGLVLGRKKGGGGYRSDVFHDILDNSEGWVDILINDKFKFTLSIWVSDRLDVYNSGASEGYFELSNDGATWYAALPPYRRTPINIELIAWENNEPLYALNYPADNYSLNPHVSSVSVRLDASESKYFYYMSEEKIYNKGTAAFSSSDIKISFENGGYYSQYVNTPKYTLSYTNKVYEAVRELDEEIPEIVLKSESQETLDKYGTRISLAPTHNATFSDLSSEDVWKKYSEIMQAIIAADGKNFVNTRLPQ